MDSRRPCNRSRIARRSRSRSPESRRCRLPEPVEAALYYVVAESLTNAAKHSGATEGSVELSTTPETVVVEIRDNGSGGANLSGGSGLRGLVDRVEALGGTLQLESPVDGGTSVQAELPLP